MKYGKLKLKHRLIDGLRPVLEDMTGWPMVNRVIPGRIHRTGKRSHSNNLELRASVDTPTGIKLIAYSRDGTTQEIFVVATDTAGFRAALEARTTIGELQLGVRGLRYAPNAEN
jgi:hypothetical protein